MTATSLSVPRIVWDGLRRNRLLSWLFVIVLAGSWVMAVLALRESGGTDLSAVASPLMTVGWLTGMALVQFSTALMPIWKAEPGGKTYWSVQRTKSWLRSAEPTFVDLSGTAMDRATEKVTALENAGPNASFVAMPALTSLGSACIGFAFAMCLADAFVARRSSDLAPVLIPTWVIMLTVMLCGAAASVGSTSLRIHRWAAERAARAAEVRAGIERAKLAALQTQMNPHFLFNTLNTVAALAGPESSRAERLVEHLSTVLRQSMQRTDRPFTTLEDEVRLLRAYLEVEGERLGWRLRVDWHINHDTLPLRVPSMCLLPLVENAIVHAVEARPAGAHVEISASIAASGYLLKLSVEDSGPGFPETFEDGAGLRSLRQRLHAEYGRTCELDIETLNTGTRVTVTFPATRL